MKPLYSICYVFLLAIISISINAQNNHPVVHGHTLEHRMIRLNGNMILPSSYENLLTLMTRASDACYNGVILGDAYFGFLEEVENHPIYMPNLQNFLDSASTLGMIVLPEIGYYGYSSRILFHNPNMAEGMPVVDAPYFVVDNGNGLELEPDYSEVSFPLLNGDFENIPNSGHIVPGWTWQDGAGTVTFIDQEVSHSGNASIRVENPNQDPNGNGRVVQTVTDVEQFRDYHVSVWVKTENFDPSYVNMIVNNNESRLLEVTNMTVESNQDWTEYHFTFNSLNSTSINIFLGVWSGGNGKLWWDDLVIEPTKCINILRRETTPVRMKRPDGTILTEGVDVDMIVDPFLGQVPFLGAYTNWHEEPTITIPNGSSLQLGDEVLLSYYHTTTILDGYNGQVCASLTEPEVFDITEQQNRNVRDVFAASNMFGGWSWQYDEIRIHGWDESPSYGTSGDNLAYCFQENYDRARAIDDDALIMTYNSMFDPFHNAFDDGAPFYLVKDYFAGSWEGVPSDVVIVNWINVAPWRGKSSAFYAERGHPQILSGFYDAPFFVKDWLNETEGMDGIFGVAYATFANDYSQIEAWAEYAWGGCNFTTSTQDIEEQTNDLTIIPNPVTTNEFQLSLSESENIQLVELYNKAGQLIWQEKGDQRTINLPTHFAKGIYFVKVTTAKASYREKVLIL